MSNYIVRDTAALFDPVTGQWVGVIDGSGQEHVVVPAGSKAVAAATSLSGGFGFIDPVTGGVFSVAKIVLFPDFQPSILASFVAGSTASQSGNTVTVTAAAHGIVGSASRNGYRIYYPGSPSIPAGWYGGFAWVSANTITFVRQAAATVASESVNSGAAFVSAQDVCALTLPASAVYPGTSVAAVLTRSGDTTTASKILRLNIAGLAISAATLTTAPNSTNQRIGFVCPSKTSQVGSATVENASTSGAQTIGSVDTNIDQALTVSAQVSAAAGYMCIDACCLEIA